MGQSRHSPAVHVFARLDGWFGRTVLGFALTGIIPGTLHASAETPKGGEVRFTSLDLINSPGLMAPEREVFLTTEARNLRVLAYITKPFRVPQVLDAAAHALAS